MTDSAEQDGLLSVIDLKDKQRVYVPVDIRFGSPEAFLVADSRGQVTMFQLKANRYMVVSQRAGVAFATFTGKVPHDQVLVAMRDKTLSVHSLNGKLLEQFKGAHGSEIRGLESNKVQGGMGHMVTVSADACVLWACAGAVTVAKQKSIFSHDGNSFTQARFTTDGLSLVTLLREGDFVSWRLDAQQEMCPVSLSFKTQLLTCFDVAGPHIVASGRSLPFLIVKDHTTGEQRQFRLPTGCRGVDKLSLLRDDHLVGLISEGYFYLVDIGERVTAKLQIRVPNERVITFDIDEAMSQLVLGTA